MIQYLKGLFFTETGKDTSIVFVGTLINLICGGVVCVLFSQILANYLGHPEITQLLRVAFATTIFVLLTNFFVAALQSKREFLKASIVNISSNVARFGILIIAISFWTIGLYFFTILFFF